MLYIHSVQETLRVSFIGHEAVFFLKSNWHLLWTHELALIIFYFKRDIFTSKVGWKPGERFVARFSVEFRSARVCRVTFCLRYGSANLGQLTADRVFTDFETRCTEVTHVRQILEREHVKSPVYSLHAKVAKTNSFQLFKRII